MAVRPTMNVSDRPSSGTWCAGPHANCRHDSLAVRRILKTLVPIAGTILWQSDPAQHFLEGFAQRCQLQARFFGRQTRGLRRTGSRPSEVPIAGTILWPSDTSTVSTRMSSTGANCRHDSLAVRLGSAARRSMWRCANCRHDSLAVRLP